MVEIRVNKAYLTDLVLSMTLHTNTILQESMIPITVTVYTIRIF